MDVYADLVQRDRLVPGLGLLFDPARLARLLEVHAGVTLSAFQQVYVRYKAGTSCLVGYRARGSAGESYVYAKAFPLSARHKLDKPLASRGAATWLGPGPLVLRDAGVIAWAYPNDCVLRDLSRIADGPGRGYLLRRAPEALRDPATEFRPLSYRPERRFVAALLPPGTQTPVAVVKMYARGGYEFAVERTHRVTSGGVLRVQTRLARDSRRHLIFLDWLPGRLVGDLVSSEGPRGDEVWLAGAALAELHGHALLPSMPRSSSYDLATLPRVIADVVFLFPRLAEPLRRLRARLCGTQAPQVTTPIHGDFHLRQVVVSRGTAGVVDFDRAGAGPAAGDIACCLAHLERDVLAGAVTRQRAADIAAELLAGYQRVRPLPAAVNACTAAALARLLPEPFRYCRPDAFDLTARMLDRALSVLSRSGAGLVATCG